jgi:hypothetical protein
MSAVISTAEPHQTPPDRGDERPERGISALSRGCPRFPDITALDRLTRP